MLFVSIIIATYNRANLITNALNTIKLQTNGNFECIIIDDASIDDTKEVICNFIKNDNRFKYFLRERKYKKGLSGSRNMGLDLAQGEWVIFFDDDDLVHHQNLEISLKAAMELNCDFVHYRKSKFDSYNERENYKTYFLFEFIDKTQLLKVLNNYYGISSCSVLWRRDMFNNLRFNENLKYAEEWELFTKMISLNDKKGVFIDNVLYYNKKHAESNTGRYFNNEEEMVKSYYEAIKSITEFLKSTSQLSFRIKYFLINLGFNLRHSNQINDLVEIISINLFENLFWTFYLKLLPFKVELTKKIHAQGS